MKINYSSILKKNMINVFKDVLLYIKDNGLSENHHLYITFKVNDKNVKIPKWLKEKYPINMTIVIQYEYWNFEIKKNFFTIGLSFNDINTDLEIPFESVISFADPYANFGLKLIQEENTHTEKTKTKTKIADDNIIDFKNFKKN